MRPSKIAKLLIRLCPLIALVVAACAPTASGTVAVPTLPAATVIPAVATPTPLPPTATRPPATNSPVPPTPTRVPPTATATATASATPTPGPGAVLFDVAKDKCSWFPFGFDPAGTVHDFTATNDGGKLYIEIPGARTYAYQFCRQDFKQDVQFDLDVKTIKGPTHITVGLVCRAGSNGWYEADINDGGDWTVFKSLNGSFKALASGHSAAMHAKGASNHLRLLCLHDLIAFYVNEETGAIFQDSQFSSGWIGVVAATFDQKGPGVSFENLTVRIPDPANLPGGIVVPATSAATGCRLNYLAPIVVSFGLYQVSADGFAPNDSLNITLTGIKQADGTTPESVTYPTAKADAQGHYEGPLFFSSGGTPKPGARPSWDLTIAGMSCKVTQIVTRP